MNQKMKTLALLLVVVMLCGILGGCGEDPVATTNTTVPTGPAMYTVKVVDPLGNPVPGLAVKFMQNGQQVGMALGNDEGVASKRLERGDYTLLLSFTDSAHTYYYDESALTMSATKTELEVVVAYAMDQTAEELYVNEVIHNAYYVEAGCTYVNLADAGRNYFIFTPNVAGIYEFSTQGADVTIGYYGSPYFVFEQSVATMEDGKFQITIAQSMIGTNGTGTTRLVIGVDSAVAGENCYLCIDRVGDPPAVVEWESYRATYKPTKYDLPAGQTIREFDLSAATYNLVFNESDGYYHLNSADGPVVLVRLLEANPYTGFAFGNILLGSNVGVYYYDDNGEVVRKVLYNDCLHQYLGEVSGEGENRKFTGGMCDDTYGVYPLTKDLETIIKTFGEYQGYWNALGGNYVLNGVSDLNPENAWLFLCCYAE